MNQKNLITSNVHVSAVMPGDCILHDGKMKTVGRKDIKRSDFMGTTIFGDSFNLGTKAVVKMEYTDPRRTGK